MKAPERFWRTVVDYGQVIGWIIIFLAFGFILAGVAWIAITSIAMTAFHIDLPGGFDR